MAQIDPTKLQSYLANQIQLCQIAWTDATLAKNDADVQQYERIMDVLFDFGNKFLGIPIPTGGQGYQASQSVYANVTKQRQLDAIDAQISDLQRQRQSIKDS